MVEQPAARMKCTDCGATFPRRDVATPAKGTLACPKCGSADIEHVESAR